MSCGKTLACSVALLFAAGCAGIGGSRGPVAAGETAATSADVGFLAADLDGDARISPREFNTWRQTNAVALDRFEAADTNHDGTLTLDEWQAVVRRPSAAAAGGSTRRDAIRR